MPLHLNLLHEQQQQLMERRRDPIKLGALVGLILILLFTGGYLYRLQRVASLEGEVAALQAEWSAQEPKMEEARLEAEELQKVIDTTTGLVAVTKDRFFWAPLLEQISANVSPEVQLTSVTGAKPIGSDEVQVTLEGIAAALQPRKVAEDLRLALLGALAQRYSEVRSEFRSLEDGTEPVSLNGEAMPTAKFVILVQLKKNALAAETKETVLASK